MNIKPGGQTGGAEFPLRLNNLPADEETILVNSFCWISIFYFFILSLMLVVVIGEIPVTRS